MQTIAIGLSSELQSFYNEKFLAGKCSKKELQKYPGVDMTNLQTLINRVAKLTSTAQDGHLIEVVAIDWRSVTNHQKDDFVFFSPLLAWDYQTLHLDFEKSALSSQTKWMNHQDVIVWNMNKKYLKELQQDNQIPIVPTMFVDNVNQSACDEAYEKFQTAIVIKPEIGANAGSQLRLMQGAKLPPNSEGSDTKTPLYPPPNCPSLIQPFISTVTSRGEISLIFLDGQFLHSVIKLPQNGDYRIQETYGGCTKAFEATEKMIEFGQTILQIVENRFNKKLLYARVDILYQTNDDDEKFFLGELELIEPSLYLNIPENNDEIIEKVASAFRQRAISILKDNK